MPESSTIQHRWMICSDLMQVLCIEKQVSEYPWDESDFRKRIGQQNAVGLIAQRCSRTVGYVVFELHKDRVYLLKLAVDPAVQRCGVGVGLIDQLKRRLSVQRRNRILCEVSERNLAAQLFLRSQGFRVMNILDDWFEDGEQAYLFQFRVWE